MAKMNWDKERLRAQANRSSPTGRVARADLDARHDHRMSTTWHPSARRAPRAAFAFAPGDSVTIERKSWGTVLDSNLKTTSVLIGNNRKMVVATVLCVAA